MDIDQGVLSLSYQLSTPCMKWDVVDYYFSSAHDHLIYMCPVLVQIGLTEIEKFLDQYVLVYIDINWQTKRGRPSYSSAENSCLA